MNEILHANIFFIIASIATVVFCIMTCVILFHLIKIVRTLRSIIERVELASEVVAEDVSQVRDFIANGSMLSRIFNFVSGSSTNRRSGRRRKTDDE